MVSWAHIATVIHEWNSRLPRATGAKSLFITSPHMYVHMKHQYKGSRQQPSKDQLRHGNA